MGSTQSGQTRTHTFENGHQPGPSVLISDDVKQRLYQTYSQGDGNQQTAPTNVHSKYGYNQSQIPQAYNETSVPACSDPYQKNTNQYDLLAQNDLYWRKNMANMEQSLHKTNTIMEQEFNLAYENVQETFARPPPSHRVPPCQNLKSKLFQCYSENTGETLRCLGEVSAFVECVNRNRVRRLDSDNASIL
ncbi:unnamed protein product [Hermetia illucens]|uniref:CHCH domain-containing protein n=1 Tax=Hermetia illucens TaxID=343691 RepID=A0A7R8Z1W0_HERIL|nr:uncharacterized protein LOC119657733 [Hermetia illucens]CAD7090121.1 unnamed protein product [Hermetia illucens]